MEIKQAVISLLEDDSKFRGWVEALEPKTKLRSPIEEFLKAQGFEEPSVTQAHVDVCSPKIVVFGVNEEGWDDNDTEDMPWWIADFVGVLWAIKWEYLFPANVIKILELIKRDDFYLFTEKASWLFNYRLLNVEERGANNLPVADVSVYARLSAEEEGNLKPLWRLPHFCRLEVVTPTYRLTSEEAYYRGESKERLFAYDLAGFILAHSD